MKYILDLIAHIVFVLFSVALHVVLVTLFEYPVSAVNILLIVIVIHLLLYDSIRVVWMSLAIFYILELFVSSPFGVLLFTGCLTAYGAFALHINVFPNRSLIASTSLLVTTVILFRVLYAVFGFVISLFTTEQFQFVHLLGYMGWEVLLTGLAFLIVYPAVLFVLQRRFLIQ